MTRVEYMQHLEQALQGYNTQFIQEIMDNYNEHFETGLKDGRTEEEICQELGAVEGLLKDIQELMGDRDIRTHELEKFTAITEQKEQYDGISKVELALLSMDVELYPSADNQLHVYLKEGQEKAKYLEERISGDSYYAHELKRKKNGGLLNLLLSGTNDSPTVIVEAPKQLEALTIKTMSGELEIRDIFTKAMTLETMSGDIELDNVSTEAGLLKTTSGDMEIHQLDSKEMVVQSTSGDINWKRTGIEEAEIVTTSGDISLTDTKANRLKIKSTSGDIELRSIETSELNLSSTSGDIRGTFYTEKIQANTISGDINLTIDRRGKELAARSKTVSGSCHIYGASECIGEPDPARYITANFSTISGDVKVR